MKITIKQLIEQSKAIESQLLSTEGELDQNLERALALHNTQLAQKVDAVSYVIDSLESRIELLTDRAAELNEVRNRTELALEALKDKVLRLLEVSEGGALEGDLYTFKLRKSAGRVGIIDESKVPAKYTTIKQTLSIDKKEILAVLRNGLEVEGTKLIQEPTLIKATRKG